MTWRATIFTLFPEMFPGVLGHSLHGKGLQKGVWALDTVNPRDFSTLPHAQVDDTPYGGGTGLVLRPDVLAAAIDSVPAEGRPLYYLSPRGERFTPALARQFAAGSGIRLLCGRYEGVDERLLEEYKISELSIGDYILAGGEIAAQVVLEAALRYVPNIIGTSDVHTEESFGNGLLEYPHYTKPALWREHAVPAVLTSGHHENVAKWRLERAKELTAARRPDLWADYCNKAP